MQQQCGSLLNPLQETSRRLRRKCLQQRTPLPTNHALAVQSTGESAVPVGEPLSAGGVCSYMVHYISMDGFVYLTTTNREMSKGVVFAFLENLQRRYHPIHCSNGSRALSGVAGFRGCFHPATSCQSSGKWPWRQSQFWRHSWYCLSTSPTVSLSWICVQSSVNQTITHDNRGLEDHKTQQAHRAIDEVKHVMMENIGMQMLHLRQAVNRRRIIGTE